MANGNETNGTLSKDSPLREPEEDFDLLLSSLDEEHTEIKALMDKSGNFKTTYKARIHVLLSDAANKYMKVYNRMMKYQNLVDHPTPPTGDRSVRGTRQESYASVAGRPVVAVVEPDVPLDESGQPNPDTYPSMPDLHTTLVYPTDSRQTCQLTRSVLKAKIDLTKSNIQIANIKHLRNGGLAISMPSKQFKESFDEALIPCSADLKIYKPKKRFPMIRIRNIEVDVDEKLLLEDLLLRNSLADATTESFSFRFFSKPFKGILKNAVVQVQPSVFKQLLSRDRVFIGWTSCRVEEFLPLTRCFNCCSYGHTAKFCPQPNPTCGRCSGEHKTQECDGHSSASCINCSKNNSRRGTNSNVCHTSWDWKCPCHISISSLIRSRTDYNG
ncbi:Uncharacterised protein r2_g3039 [Pycnogonum litorale]